METAPLLNALFGAEVTGIDLSDDLDEARFARIRQLLAQHSILLFPGQRLAPRNLVAFTKGLGPIRVPLNDQYAISGYEGLHRVSNVVDEQGKSIGLPDAGVFWHSDGAYLQTPDACTLLYAIEVPRDEQGRPLGSTVFTSTALAYDGLPAAMQTRLATLQAEFSVLKQYVRKKASGLLKRDDLTDEQKAKAPSCVHPVIVTHPVSGRRCIFVSDGHTTHIMGLEQAESDELLTYLYGHLLQPQFMYRHDWTEGDVLLWDNRATQHNATFDYKLPQRRVMYRTSCIGTRPS